jgi:hypothetical protein
MRRYLKENNAVVFTECPELWRYIASIVVKNKEPFTPNCYEETPGVTVRT